MHVFVHNFLLGASVEQLSPGHCLQADSGDYSSKVHTVERMQTRVANSFPSPVKEKMRLVLDAPRTSTSAPGAGPAEQLASRIQLLYSRLAGELTYTTTCWSHT